MIAFYGKDGYDENNWEHLHRKRFKEIMISHMIAFDEKDCCDENNWEHLQHRPFHAQHIHVSLALKMGKSPLKRLQNILK